MELLRKTGFRVKPGMTKYLKGLLSHDTSMRRSSAEFGKSDHAKRFEIKLNP